MSESCANQPGANQPCAPDVVVCPNGPLLLRGDHLVEAEDGTAHRTERPVSAVCRCGLTSTSPWCDGTHQMLERRKRSS